MLTVERLQLLIQLLDSVYRSYGRHVRTRDLVCDQDSSNVSMKLSSTLTVLRWSLDFGGADDALASQTPLSLQRLLEGGMVAPMMLVCLGNFCFLRNVLRCANDHQVTDGGSEGIAYAVVVDRRCSEPDTRGMRDFFLALDSVGRCSPCGKTSTASSSGST